MKKFLNRQTTFIKFFLLVFSSFPSPLFLFYSSRIPFMVETCGVDYGSGLMYLNYRKPSWKGAEEECARERKKPLKKSSENGFNRARNFHYLLQLLILFQMVMALRPSLDGKLSFMKNIHAKYQVQKRKKPT